MKPMDPSPMIKGRKVSQPLLLVHSSNNSGGKMVVSKVSIVGTNAEMNSLIEIMGNPMSHSQRSLKMDSFINKL